MKYEYKLSINPEMLIDSQLSLVVQTIGAMIEM
jgi:hypothetical protein